MSEALDITAPELVKLGPEKGKLAAAVGRFWPEAIVVALVVILWAPRLSGPIDLRWDAGVYYILGTSLAQGHGYRILSEPGAPQALQYPPLLPAVVALYERALGSSDPAVVAPWLRLSYAILFLVYALTVLALAKRYLSPILALAAVALSLLQINTIFLSDLLFAELPFALVSVAFVLVAANGQPKSRSWVREGAGFVFASVAFLLRTAGLALFAAWVAEATLRRRWWLALMRGLLALIPVLLWQGYVARVHRTHEYANPAYAYQRAPYQYYNVSYAENLHLVDPFRPELGVVNTAALALRTLTNLPRMLVAVGETASTRVVYWRQLLGRSQQLFGRAVLAPIAIFLPLLILAALVLFGLVLLIYRGAWLLVLIVIGSITLSCTTPWPAQFDRYLVGLTPFFAICTFLSVSWIWTSSSGWRFNRTGTLVRVAITGLIAITFISQIFAALKLFQQRQHEAARATDRAGASAFYHDPAWEAWEEAATWIKARAKPDAIIATSAPHSFYLRTGLRAVLPPMEANQELERHLLEGVPISYVIVDELNFLDVSRRYARPAIENDANQWRLVHATAGAKTYARIGVAE